MHCFSSKCNALPSYRFFYRKLAAFLYSELLTSYLVAAIVRFELLSPLFSIITLRNKVLILHRVGSTKCFQDNHWRNFLENF